MICDVSDIGLTRVLTRSPPDLNTNPPLFYKMISEAQNLLIYKDCSFVLEHIRWWNNQIS